MGVALEGALLRFIWLYFQGSLLARAQVKGTTILTVTCDLCEYLPPEDENTANRLLSSRRIDLAGAQAAVPKKRRR